MLSDKLFVNNHSPTSPAQRHNVVSLPRHPRDAARRPQRPLRARESQVASHGRRARHRGTLLPQHGGVDLSPHGHPQTPHSAAPVVSLPDIREMRRGDHSGLYGRGGAMVALFQVGRGRGAIPISRLFPVYKRAGDPCRKLAALLSPRAMRLQTIRCTVQFRHVGFPRMGLFATMPENWPHAPHSAKRGHAVPAKLAVRHSGLSGAGDVSGAVLENPRGASCWEFRKRGAAALFAG